MDEGIYISRAVPGLEEIDLLILKLTFKHFVSRCTESGIVWVRVCPQEYNVQKPDFDVEFVNLGYKLVNEKEDGDGRIEFAYQKSN